MLILTFYISGIQITAIDRTMSDRLLYYETQAKQGAEAGLEICLRLASATAPCNYSVYSFFTPGTPVCTTTVFYEATAGNPSRASVTAIILDGNNLEVARKSARRQIDTTSATTRLFLKDWVR